MSQNFSSEIGLLKQSRFGPLTCHLSEFISFLQSQGYSPVSLEVKIKIIYNFSKWIVLQEKSISDLSESDINNFFEEHPRAGYIQRGDLSTLLSLLEWLRVKGATNVLLPKTDNSNFAAIEHDFAQYLEKERGLSKATLSKYVPVIGKFLNERFGPDPIAFNSICAHDVIQFVLRHARVISCKNAQLMTTALRGFFRYLRLRGDITLDLAAAVPTVADQNLSELPKSLDPEEITRILESCDQSSCIGQRDYTILLLLARLGLRAGEIVAMTLDDIGWENSVIKIRGKGSRYDQLPIFQDVGEALSSYIRNGRPLCDTRRVFIRDKAPRQGFSSSVAIDDVVRRALARAKLNPARKGAHLLRHSLATRMLQHGASLTEIGTILRHSTLKTTQIYAKVDMTSLKELARPWPGGDI